MIDIIELDRERYSGRKFTSRYKTKGYYDMEAIATGFDLYAYTNTDKERNEIRIEMGKRLQ